MSHHKVHAVHFSVAQQRGVQTLTSIIVAVELTGFALVAALSLVCCIAAICNAVANVQSRHALIVLASELCGKV